MYRIFDLLALEAELSRIQGLGETFRVPKEMLEAQTQLLREVQYKIEDELEILELRFEELVEDIEEFEIAFDKLPSKMLETSQFGAKIMDALEDLIAVNMIKELG